MMYIRWLLLLPIEIGFTVLALLLSPVLPAFASADGWLPRWLWWFQTPDNNLDGDQSDWCALPNGNYWRRVLWLIRNNAYGFVWNGPLCARIMPDALVRYSGDCHIQNRPQGREGWCLTTIINPDGSRYWHLYLVIKISAARCLNINAGWKLKTYAEDPTRTLTKPRAAYVFSPRIAAFVTE